VRNTAGTIGDGVVYGGPCRGIIRRTTGTFRRDITCKIVNIFYIMINGLLLQTVTLKKDRPVLSSERAPHKDKTVTVKMGLDTKAD
jgi:hypothetical protein